mgnify:CR=1 FL=1
MNGFLNGVVVVLSSGRFNGQRGNVLGILDEFRLLVENLNMVKKHQKPNPSLNQAGGIVEKESPIHVSNVALYNPGTAKADRVTFKTLGDGRKVRIFRSTGEAVDI